MVTFKNLSKVCFIAKALLIASLTSGSSINIHCLTVKTTSCFLHFLQVEQITFFSEPKQYSYKPIMSKVNTAKKAVPKKKGAHGYKLPDPIPNGEILSDIAKKKWQIGPSIGVGGFGEIYSASDMIASPKKNASNPYVIKIEPHENGPLFVEMHFYMRVGKEDEIAEWKKQKKLSHLGMPRFIGSGSHECKGVKYRFVVMDRFSTDIWSMFLKNNRVFPCPTVLKIGYQVLHTLEYIHSKSYVHADIKGANLLLGMKKGSENQVFLVDFGLASKFSKDNKPDPKKAHNGTPEYTSRDSHIGVPSMRGDLEILGYNMLQWLCSKLPWEDNLSDVVKLHQKKTAFMNDIPGQMKKCFGKTTPPVFLVKFFQYVAKLAIDEVPDYIFCCKLFKDGLKVCNSSLEGKLEFMAPQKSPAKNITTPHGKTSNKRISDERDTVDASPPKRSRNQLAKPKTNEVAKGALRQPRKAVPVDSSSESNSSEDETESDKDFKIDSRPRSKSTANPKKIPKKPRKALVSLQTKPSWRDCPTAIASKVLRPGEYTANDTGEKSRKRQLP